LITIAEDADDAASTVEFWIEDHFEKEFFDWGKLEEPKKVVPLSEIKAELENGLEEWIAKRLAEVEADIAKHKASGDRMMEGYCHIRYGHILSEDCCQDMPHFNITDWCWGLSQEIPEGHEGKDWYAVRVDLHF
jgi:hypothetical protein